MLSRTQKCLVLAVLVLLASSCTKIPQVPITGQGTVAIESAPTTGSIPLKYGNLVSVTTTPDMNYWFQLWYQDEQGNIRIVLYQAHTNRLGNVVRLIPRK